MMLNVDIDFKNILPPLSTQEYMELEKSIKEKGVLSPILVWNSYIVDGHNRYEICTTNRIDNFPGKEVEVNNKEEVLEWILSHQLGRRNLTDFPNFSPIRELSFRNGDTSSVNFNRPSPLKRRRVRSANL